MPVSISVPTLVIELVIFIATVWLMERLVFSPIRAAWSERERLVQAGLAASGESRAEAEAARAEVQRILSEARLAAQTEIDKAVTRGNETRDQLVEQATAEFRRLLDEARGQIAAERDRNASALQGRVVDLALLAASHVTGQSFDRSHVRRLAASVVEREGLR